MVALTGGSGAELRFEPVARVDAFPGMSQSRGTVVISIERLRALGVPYTESLWVAGDVRDALGGLREAGIEVLSVRVPEQALDTATFLPVIWTFGLVRALAVLAGSVAAVGLLAYLDARQRARQLAYGLSRHMGLRRTTHRWSILVELCIVVVPATAGGVVAGMVAGDALTPVLDPLPRFPPATVAMVPWQVVAAAAGAAVVVCLLGAVLGQRTADRARLAAALRHGG